MEDITPKKRRKLPKRIVALIVCAVIVGTILIAALGCEIAFRTADKIECWRPDYEKIDLQQIIDKDSLSDEDYSTLYAQTGLTKIGVDRLLSNGKYGKNRLLNIQEDFFAEHEVKNDWFAPYICTDYIEKDITTTYLRDGDILVTSSTHLTGWRMGHAGLVTNGLTSQVLQANAYGSTSYLGRADGFTDRVNFMVLSPKVDDSIKAEVVKNAKEKLLDLPYDFTVGVLTNKNKISRTQCAHIVWYAYKEFGGVDLDVDGGLVVTPRNLARSPQMEVVQVFGFDPEKLWY